MLHLLDAWSNVHCAPCSLFYSVDPPLSKKQHVSLYDYDVATDDEVEESQPVKKKMKKGGEKVEKKGGEKK